MSGRRILRLHFYAILLFGTCLIGLGLVYVNNHAGILRLDRMGALRQQQRLNVTEHYGHVQRQPRQNVTEHYRHGLMKTNRPMAKMEAHYNMTSIRNMQNITRKYFDPIRHIIYFSDYDIFMRKCQPFPFTLLKSGRKRKNLKPCNVTHTPVKHYRTCAVVGNSGILLHSSCGAEIDSHEFVIRSNLPPVYLYRQDVGNRTDLTTVNERRLTQIHEDLQSKNKTLTTPMLKRLAETPGMVLAYTLTFVRSKAKIKMQHIDKVLKKNKISVVTAFPHKSFLRSRGLYKELVGKQWKFASTGLNTFALASTFCDKISMYGFYPMSTYQDRNVTYHYYDSLRHSTRHEFDDEYDLLRQLHDRGIIRHVVGKCDLD